MENFFTMLNWFKIVLKSFDFWSALDVIVVAIIIFGIIKLIRDTKAVQFVKGLFVILIIFICSDFLKLKMLKAILGTVFQFGTLVLIVVFQPELRKILERLGRSNFGEYWNLEKILGIETNINKSVKNLVEIISDTVFEFQKIKRGALIVFERKSKLGEVISTGTITLAYPSKNLISNIFFNKSPLHDGAMIIKNGAVYACGCILPLSNAENFSDNLGTRHRAAIGISESSDAVAVVVSEETGYVSIAVDGVLTENYSYSEFKNTIEELISPKDNENFSKFFKNFRNRKL